MIRLPCLLNTFVERLLVDDFPSFELNVQISYPVGWLVPGCLVSSQARLRGGPEVCPGGQRHQPGCQHCSSDPGHCSGFGVLVSSFIVHRSSFILSDDPSFIINCHRYWWFILHHSSGQIIATSHDRFHPNCGLGREFPLCQGKLGWWNIIIWTESSFIIIESSLLMIHHSSSIIMIIDDSLFVYYVYNPLLSLLMIHHSLFINNDRHLVSPPALLKRFPNDDLQGLGRNWRQQVRDTKSRHVA